MVDTSFSMEVTYKSAFPILVVFVISLGAAEHFPYELPPELINYIPCEKFNPTFKIQCACSEDPQKRGIDINCDYVTFEEQFPILPFRFRIRSFSQTHVGYQNLPAQIFTASDIPLQKLDLSNNLLRRITDKLLEGVEETLEELNLGHNLLGDMLTPVFSTNELKKLRQLRILDLSYNKIKDMDAGIFRGCDNLLDLRLHGNTLTRIPRDAMEGPNSIKSLTLQNNYIQFLPSGGFQFQPDLIMINLTDNFIHTIEDGAFQGLRNLRILMLSNNKIVQFPNTVFSDLKNLEVLDLSNNFLTSVPQKALNNLGSLKWLILHSNHLKTLSKEQLDGLTSLEVLDLDRNNLLQLGPGTFERLRNLKSLHLSVNTLRKVEDDAFEGLEYLETLNLNDNNLLFLPTDNALEVLPRLRSLSLDFNRISVISAENLQHLGEVEEFSLAYNLIRDIPEGAFKNFTRLRVLNFYGNQLSHFNQVTFSGLEPNLMDLNLGYNEISSLETTSFPVLEKLQLSKNHISILGQDSFKLMKNLVHLDLSHNRLSQIQPQTFDPLAKLRFLDLSHNDIKVIPSGMFQNLQITTLKLANNKIDDIYEKAFINLHQLTSLDMSHNHLVTIKLGAIDGKTNLKDVNLSHNGLQSYKSDVFGPSNSVGRLDLSHNNIASLKSNSLGEHSSLAWLNLENNNLASFSGQMIKDNEKLKYINLNNNKLRSLEESDFANLKALQYLTIAHNEISSVNERSFQNSTQMKVIDLGHNMITKLPQDLLYGTGNLKLNLEYNFLSQLPEAIFDRTKIQRLEYLNLDANVFQEVPIEALERQYFFLNTLNLARNKIETLPSKAVIMANIKNLDLSYNPLTEESIENVLNEPKTVRSLNMAGTGIREMPILETPFLRSINLSDNRIAVLNDAIFERASWLQSLDVSKNRIPNLSFGLTSAWPKLAFLEKLDISNNPISYIIKGDFAYLDNLQQLTMNNLPDCNKIEPDAFTSLPNLKELEAHSYPSIKDLNVPELVRNLRGLTKLDIEVFQPVIQDDLQAIYSPRLSELKIRGKNIRSLSSAALAGINSPEIKLSLTNTGISSISGAVFFPVSSSSNIEFEIPNNEISSLNSQFISMLEDKQRNIELKGLQENPIYCDCNVIPLQKWLQEESSKGQKVIGLECSGPRELQGRLLNSIPKVNLTCDGRSSTTTTPAPLTRRRTTEKEPDIIWTAPPSDPAISVGQSEQEGSLNNMDALIIGIVGGVVAFIVILIIIICMMRLKSNGTQYQGGPLVGPLALRAQGKCTCLKPPVPPNFHHYPTVPSNAIALAAPPPMMAKTMAIQPTYSTLQRPYYPTSSYYVTFPPEETDHR